LQDSPQTVHLISLGCARNRVDSEVMLSCLLENHWLYSKQPEEADVIIINTCGFIHSAKEESIDTILTAAEHKKNKPNMRLVVSGCLPQRHQAQLVKGFPEVDLFVGTDEFHRIAELLSTPVKLGNVFTRRSHEIYDDNKKRIQTINPFWTYVKIAEGCQHHCSFCIIPAIRGTLRSRPVDSIQREVETFISSGAKEINLIAQDLAAYGMDWGKKDLIVLLQQLVKIPDLPWIRLLYMYPENIQEDFLKLLSQEQSLLKYFDIPIQHACDRILARMNRAVTNQMLRKLFDKIRYFMPNATFRTSVMVGFPGETEDDFKLLLDFIEEQQFDHLGCFTYSRETGTQAAKFPDQIPETIKKERQERLMLKQRKISSGKLRELKGQKLPVLVEGNTEKKPDYCIGRLASQAPEVDGLVYIHKKGAKIGHIQSLEITETFDYDIVGKIIGNNNLSQEELL